MFYSISVGFGCAQILAEVFHAKKKPGISAGLFEFRFEVDQATLAISSSAPPIGGAPSRST